MPSPVVLKVQFAPKGPAIKPMANAKMTDSVTAIVTYPVDVWFAGSKTFKADLDFGGRKIEKITLDPFSGVSRQRDATNRYGRADCMANDKPAVHTASISSMPALAVARPRTRLHQQPP